MTTISQQYLELIIVILLLSIIFSIIFKLYRKNAQLIFEDRRLKSDNNLLSQESIRYKTEIQNYQESLKKLEELESIEHKYYELTGEYKRIQENETILKEELGNLKVELLELRDYKQRTKSLEEALESKKTLLQNMQEEMAKEFKLLSSELLEQKQQSLQKSSNEQFKLLLEPFESELKSFKSRLEQMHENQHKSLSTLRGELMQIKTLNQTLANEANALTKALKGDSKVQGNWGEMILEKALELSGLRKGIEYKREQSFQEEQGSLRADVILYLPENKHIVIDAKVSLSAYSKIVQSESKQEIESAKKSHILSLKRHIDTLATKQYHMLSDLKTPEFTLMFIPIEAAYLSAVEIDANLFEYAFERNVAVVTPTTLLTTLKTVSALWKLANHDKNMQQLANEAALMHDKFALFLEEFLTLEQRLQQAQSAYDNAKLRLISGQGSLFNKIEKVGKLSSKTKKELPQLKSDET